MKINIFEGARRISKGIGALWVIGCVAYGVSLEPGETVTYAVPDFGSEPVLADSCGTEDAQEFFSTKTLNGKSIYVTLCFSASRSSDGRLLVPYSIGPPKTDTTKPWENYRVWMNERYSTDVREYTKRTAAQFKFTEIGSIAAEKKIQNLQIANWKTVIFTLVGGLLFLWIFTAAVGWIVRGFMGIPNGKDTHTEESQKS